MTDPAAPRPRDRAEIEADAEHIRYWLGDDPSDRDADQRAAVRLAADVAPLLAALDRARADYRKLWDMTVGPTLRGQPTGPPSPDTRESLLARIPEVQTIITERNAALARIESMLDAAVSTARRVPSPYADNVLNAVRHVALAVPVEPTPEEQ